MKMSKLYAPTLKEIPAEAELVSHKFLLKAGYIRKVSAGVYSYLPLAWRVLKKIEDICVEEMDAIGSQQILMSILQPSELWQRTGRWEDYGPEMMKIEDRKKRLFALSPTHEELVTYLLSGEIKSYKQLPLLLYHISTKYRDEIRPRFGLMRSREFIMKDLYSFHTDFEDLNKTYWKVYEAYSKIFKRMRLNFRAVEADSGQMGGNLSHEFVLLVDSGENDIAYCENCGYYSNIEAASSQLEKIVSDEKDFEKQEVPTPNAKTIEQVSKFLNVKPEKLVKTMLYKTKDGYIAVLIRGDRDVNEFRLKAYFEDPTIEMASEDEVIKLTNAPVGFAGPIGLDIKIYADESVKGMKNFVVGGNKKDIHIINVNHPRDFKIEEFIDVKTVRQGDRCPKCGHTLNIIKGIEIGQIFQLGTKYSKPLGLTYLDKNGKSNPVVMGSYGIGVSRLLGAIIEQYHDDNGIIWPYSVAPYQIIITVVNYKNEAQREVADLLYENLKGKYEVIIDDRDIRPGPKFADADLIGIPIRITVGRKAKDGIVELKARKDKEGIEANIADANLQDLYEKLDKMVENLNA